MICIKWPTIMHMGAPALKHCGGLLSLGPLHGGIRKGGLKWGRGSEQDPFESLLNKVEEKEGMASEEEPEKLQALVDQLREEVQAISSRVDGNSVSIGNFT